MPYRNMNIRTGDTTNFVDVFHDIFSTWLEVSEEGYAVRHSLEIVDSEFDTNGVRDRN